ncbi:MAG: TetR family transcriptional regulator [Acidobacteria bacterium]|jgi:DNA-binding transcriptional regulator YbjK|nr:TetR family transcriptional regulator [Acidobacteriota bacterium]
MQISAGEKTRQQILRGALAVIEKEGVDAITHRRVGSEAEQSHGVVSYHFPTRDVLIQKAFEFHLGSAENYVSALGLRTDQRLTRAHLSKLLTRLVAEELADARSIKIDLELSLYGARKPTLAELFDNWMRIGCQNLSLALHHGGYEQPDELARSLVNLMRGFLLECLTNKTLTKLDFQARLELLLPASPIIEK